MSQAFSWFRQTLSLALVLAGVGMAAADTLSVSVGAAPAPVGKVATVPIIVKDATQLGCLQLALVYDKDLLEFKGVDRGPLLPEDALLDFDWEEPGRLVVGFVFRPKMAAFEKSGTVLKVRFRVRGKVGQKAALRLEDVRAWEKSDREMIVASGNGTVTVSAATGPESEKTTEKVVEPPAEANQGLLWVVILSVSGTLLVLLLGVILVLNRRAGRSAGLTRFHCAVCNKRLKTSGAAPGRKFCCPKCGTMQVMGG